MVIGFSLALALMVLPAMAEDAKTPQGPRGGGPGGGFQGRGMMGGGMGFGGGKIYLAQNPQVVTELKITDEQKTKITEITKAIQTQMGTPQRQQGATQEERKKAMEERTAKMQKANLDAEKKLAEVLKPEQMKRLDEISLQQRGIQALKDEVVTKALKITKEQIEKIDAAQKAGQEEQQKLFQERRTAGQGQGGPGGNAEAGTAMREKMEKIRKDTETKVLAALTDEQKAAFEKMKGTAFKLEMPQRGQRGQGGPGQGQGGGRRRGGQDGQGKAETKPETETK